MGRDRDSLLRLYDQEIDLIAEKSQYDQFSQELESDRHYKQVISNISQIRQHIEQHEHHSIETQQEYLREKLQELNCKFTSKCASCKHASPHITSIIDNAIELVTFTSEETVNLPEDLESLLKSISTKLENEPALDEDSDMREWYKDSIDTIRIDLEERQIPEYAIPRITEYTMRLIRLRQSESEAEQYLNDILYFPQSMIEEFADEIPDNRVLEEGIHLFPAIEDRLSPSHEAAFCMIRNDSEYTLGGIFCPDAEPCEDLLNQDNNENMKAACKIILRELEELKKV